MDSGWLTMIKDTSPIVVIVVAVLAVLGFRWLRSALGEDVRAHLGLHDGETLESKINTAVASAVEGAVEPLTATLQGQAAQIADGQGEARGMRTGLTNHGERISILEMEVAALTAQVGGPTAVHALRGRLERRKVKGEPPPENEES